MKKFNLLIIVLSIILGLSSCVTRSSISLNGKKWHLETFEGTNNEIFKDTSVFNISFVNDSTINGIGACNRFFGRYKAGNDGVININMGGSTRMACPNMDIEQNYFIALDKVNQFKIEGNILILSEGDNIIATFK